MGIRDRVDLTLVTPLPGAFTKPRATMMLSDILDRKNIKVIPEFMEMSDEAQIIFI